MKARALIESLVCEVENDLAYLAKAINLSDGEKRGEAARSGAHHLADWLGRLDEPPEDIQVDEDEPWEAVDELEQRHPELFQEFGEWVADKLLADDPTDAPPSLHMDFERYVRDEWLIHFSDDAGSIWNSGFKYGISPEDHHRVALSTYWKDTVRKKGPGLNFAFIADQAARYVGNNTGRNQKYGREAVMFRADGVLVHHHGDQENQVIFLGRTAHDLVYLWPSEEDGKWHVGETKGGRSIFSADQLSDVVKWVERNHGQYRKALRPERERPSGQ